jgi:hypothetical protein
MAPVKINNPNKKAAASFLKQQLFYLHNPFNNI